MRGLKSASEIEVNPAGESGLGTGRVPVRWAVSGGGRGLGGAGRRKASFRNLRLLSGKAFQVGDL